MAQIDRPALERYLVGRRQVPALERFLDAFSGCVDSNTVEKRRSSISDYRMIAGIHRDIVGGVRPIHQIISIIVKGSRTLGEADGVGLQYFVYRDPLTALGEADFDLRIAISDNTFWIDSRIKGASTERFSYAAMLGSLQAVIMGSRPVSS